MMMYNVVTVADAASITDLPESVIEDALRQENVLPVARLMTAGLGWTPLYTVSAVTKALQVRAERALGSGVAS